MFHLLPFTGLLLDYENVLPDVRRATRGSANATTRDPTLHHTPLPLSREVARAKPLILLEVSN